MLQLCLCKGEAKPPAQRPASSRHNFFTFFQCRAGEPGTIRDWESSWEHPRRWIYLNPENLGVPRLGVTPSHGQHSTHPTASPKPAACTVKGEQTASRPLLSCLMCVFHMQVLPHSQTGLCPSQANPHLFNINKALIERSIGNLPLHARLGELTKAPVGAGE